MRRIALTATLTAVAVLATYTFCAAENPATDEGLEKYIEMLRTELRADKKAVLEIEMEFTDEEAKAFWPVYAEYELESKKWGDKWMKLAKDYYQVHDQLTDEIADDLINGSMDLKEERINLRRKYFKRFAKAISPARAAQFMQLEAQINLLIDVQIAAELPLVQPVTNK